MSVKYMIESPPVSGVHDKKYSCQWSTGWLVGMTGPRAGCGGCGWAGAAVEWRLDREAGARAREEAGW